MLHVFYCFSAEIRLSFSKPSYTVSEDAGMQTNLIAVVKEDIYIQTEKTLEVMVQSFPYTAKRGTIIIIAMHGNDIYQ